MPVGTSLLTIIQSIATMITSTLGVAIITVCVAFAALRAMIGHHWGYMWSAIGGGAVLISAAWIAQQLGGGAATP